MARLKILTSVIALTLASGTSFAQDSSRTVRILQPEQTIDKNIVRAQFIRPGDVSPEEYSRLLAEADRIRSFQSSNGALAAPVTYNAASSASVSELSPQPYSEYQAQQAQTYGNTQLSSPSAVSNQGQTYYGSASSSAYQPSVQMYGTSQSVSAAPSTTYQTSTYSQAATTPIPQTTYTTPIAAHNVMKGDTLYNISKRYGVSIYHLKDANRLASDTIKLGQILTIPAIQKTATFGTATTTSSYAAQPSPNFQSTRTTQVYTPTQNLGTTYVRNEQAVPRSGVYAVLPRDTLFSIARFACVNKDDVARINGIANEALLQPGQKLTMPSGHCLN